LPNMGGDLQWADVAHSHTVLVHTGADGRDGSEARTAVWLEAQHRVHMHACSHACAVREQGYRVQDHSCARGVAEVRIAEVRSPILVT